MGCLPPPQQQRQQAAAAGLPAGVGELRGKIKLDFTEIKKDGGQDTIHFV